MADTLQRLAGIGVCGLLAGLCWSVVGGAEPHTSVGGAKPHTSYVSADAPRTLPAATVMHAKLTSTQQVLAGLVSEDYGQISAAAHELVNLARDVPARKSGDDIDNQTYEHFRYEMVRLSAELERMGSDQNLAGAAYVHGNLTAACIGCHQHLRDQMRPIELMDTKPARALFEVEDATPLAR